MIAIHNSKVEQAITKYDSMISVFADRAKVRISILISRNIYFDSELNYLQKLYQNLPDLVKENPEQLERRIVEFESIIPSCVMKSVSKSKFRDVILIALDYEKMRSEILPSFFRELEIKACVYCNSMLTVSIENLNGKIKARLQADHFNSKSKYPFLSISLFNLYPVCGPCNNVKSANDVQFELYTSDVNKTKVSDYKFKIPRAGISKYIISRNANDLLIEFHEPPVSNPAKPFKELFDINGIYNTQKDLAEELIIKARIYNKPYKNFLITTFPELFNNSNLSNRILVGNYCNPEEIHKRPMAKFSQDIAKQLKLI